MKRPKDRRSTRRKQARLVLEATGRDYACECMGVPGCDHGFPCGYTPEEQSRADTLDANHINKNLDDLRPSNLEWLCRGCHKRKDKQSEKGVSIHEDEFGYAGLLSQLNLSEERGEVDSETVLHMQEEKTVRNRPEFPTFK